MTPDNILTYPKSEMDIQGCLDSIECTIAFDVRDWSEDSRLAWIYGIVFGWDDAEKEIQNNFRWSDADIKRLRKLHRQWIELEKTQNIFEATED